MKKVALLAIRLYQWTLSPFLGSCCRFYPSCSHYALEVIEKKGFFKGTYSALKRVLKCHPWHPGGYDPP